MTATQDAVFARLVADIPPSMAAVHQHVPEGAEPDFVMVAGITAEPGDTKGSESHAVDIAYVYRGEDRRVLLGMMAAGRAALEGQPLSAAGAELEPAEWLSSEVEPPEDGVTYIGYQQYRVVAEPA